MVRWISVMMTLACIGGCSNGNTRTRQSVCAETAPATCMYAIRCDDWAGTQEDCENVANFECCERDGTCEEEVIVDADRFDTCLATVRGATCDTHPLESEACRTAIDVPPPPAEDAGTVVPRDAGSEPDAAPIDAGDPSRLYQSCAAGAACGVAEDCYTITIESTGSACSRACAGPDDTRSCAGGHCVRIRAAVNGGPQMNETPTCLEACSTAADCSIPGWRCVSTRTGFDVCVP